MIVLFIKWTLLLIVLAVLLALVMRLCICFTLPWPKFRIIPDAIYCYYGAPGSGKSTVLAAYAKRALRAGVTVYSNIPIKGCRVFEKSDFGVWRQDNCLILWDEIGTDAHARNFKSNFGLEQIKAFKMHRHENAMLVVASQSFEDPDKIIRVLTTDIFVVSRYPKLSPFHNFVKCRRMNKKPDLDELTHQPIDLYYWAFFGTQKFYGPFIWPIYDSWIRLGLPNKPIWQVYGEPDLVLDPVTDDYFYSELPEAPAECTSADADGVLLENDSNE